MPHDTLISRIEDVARARRVEPSTITRIAVQNRRLYARLKAGGDLKLTTASALEQYLRAEEQRTHAPSPVDAAAVAQAPERGAA